MDEQALSYAEIKALCAGNPLIKEKMDLDIDVARLKVLKADHQSQQYRMEDKLLKYFPAEIEKQTGYSTGDVTDRLLDKFDSLEKENTSLHLSVLMNQGIYIDMIVKSVVENMIVGAILAIIVLLALGAIIIAALSSDGYVATEFKNALTGFFSRMNGLTP